MNVVWPKEALSSQAVLYIVGVLATGGISAWIALRALRNGTRWRLNRLKEQDFDDPVELGASEDPEGPSLENIAKASIQNQFTVTRKVMRPLLFGTTAFLALLPFLNSVPATGLSLLAGATTVLLGIAAKPVVENMIAGLVISYSKTLNLGDTVRYNGFYGTVEDISLTHTTIKIWDWRRCVVPNSKMLQEEFLSYSLHDGWVWASIEFWVNFEADIDAVEAHAIAACQASSALALRDEPPGFWVMEMGKEGVRCLIAGWAASPGEAWQLAADTRTNLIRCFQKEGIRSHSFQHDLGGERPVSEMKTADRG